MAGTMDEAMARLPASLKRPDPIVFHDDSEDELLDEYFASCVPLSNLPTPPLSASSRTPAHHLTLLVPQNASPQRLSPAVTAAYLARASLPRSTIAFAACILDSLSGFFVRTWRNELATIRVLTHVRTLKPSEWSFPVVTGSAWGAASGTGSSCKPELIVLAALAIAKSWLDDTRTGAAWWAGKIAAGTVESTEVDATIRCLLKDIGYALAAFGAEIVEEMEQEIFGDLDENEVEPEADGIYPIAGIPDCDKMHDGHAIFNDGIATPEPSPVCLTARDGGDMELGIQA
ncbi:hypothetical protein EJ06DRAFT_520799 [Trichodelitschia bisporula]|uniref:Cyclin N-terminal domain-containing protein n=1 Tax=Trichodelitschia bisporula TaxID=703511 RepID=A0A6G1I170_9PEZI|nr:hypothetical protein EJ06DRAFT_520799 [Trichodelitschia bisporula]